MRSDTIRIGVVAPAGRVARETAERVTALAHASYADRVKIVFHPQCFLSSGHFAGDDETRASAFIEVANDPQFDVLWVGRGGYGSGRIAAKVIPALGAEAREKTYLGYSDAGALFGALYRHGIGRIFHGPMPSDMLREKGETAVARALSFLVDRDTKALEPNVSRETPSAAFNITILAHLLGTPFEPDLSAHVVMLEEVGEYMYRIDRTLLQITSNPLMRRAKGLRLGRCSAIPINDPEFGQSEEDVIRHWCDVSGIPYLGRADIGHDVDNKIVPFGRL
jgi:muramoyltetrapeptide carboxypeptidase